MVVPYKAVHIADGGAEGNSSGDGGVANAVAVRLCRELHLVKADADARRLAVVEMAGVLGGAGEYGRWTPYPSARGFLVFLTRHFDVVVWSFDEEALAEGHFMGHVGLVNVWGTEMATGGKLADVWTVRETSSHSADSTVFVVPAGGKGHLGDAAAALAVVCEDEAATGKGGALRAKLQHLAHCAATIPNALRTATEPGVSST